MAPNLTIPSSALITGETTRAEAAETLRPTANSPLSDPIGRTQVLGTSTIAAPSLRQFVFVDDAIGGQPGAVGDVKRITDGAITTGTNQLSSPSYTFTAADIGKVVEILGAITTSTAPNLYGYIGSVAGGVASIVSTHGGSTPVNASVTVTGATVTFGTDDSAVLQTAANAVSAAGGGILSFTPFKSYWFSKHVPASNVTYDGQKATFYVMPLPADGVNPSPAIFLAPWFGYSLYHTTVSGTGQVISTTPSSLNVVSTAGFPQTGYLSVWGVTNVITYTGISGNSFTGCTVAQGSFTASTLASGVGYVGVHNITFKQMNWLGHGKEVHDQFPIWVNGGTNFRMYECYLSLFAVDGIDIQDFTGARVMDCTLDRVCSAFPPGTNTTGNPINFVPAGSSSAYPLTDIHCEGNTILGQISAGIDITCGSNSNPPQLASFKAVITSNVIDGPSSVFASIIVELGGSGGVPNYPAQDVVIANNNCTGGTISCYLDGNSPTMNQDQTLLSRVIVAGNIINGATGGVTNLPAIDFRASYGLVTGNIVRGYAGISISPNQVHVAITGDMTNGSPTVNNVSGGGAIIRGAQLSGTGIPSGTFLQAGAGTTTWTMSQAFTGTTGTALALTATPPAQNMKVANNSVHIVPGGTSTIYGIQVNNIINSSIADNNVVFDPGVASGRGISVAGSGWLKIRDNDVENAATDGMLFTGSNDLRVRGNDIYNPSASGAGSNGIRHGGLTGTSNLFVDNDIVDDRSTHLMASGITSNVAGSTAPVNLRIRSNTILGTTGNPVDNLTSQFNGVIELRNNITDKPTTFPAGINAITVGANPYTYTNTDPYPQQVLVSGGTVSQIQISRNNGTTFFTTGATGGPTMMLPGDQLKVTYTAAPVMDKVPLW